MKSQCSRMFDNLDGYNIYQRQRQRQAASLQEVKHEAVLQMRSRVLARNTNDEILILMVTDLLFPFSKIGFSFSPLNHYRK